MKEDRWSGQTKAKPIGIQIFIFSIQNIGLGGCYLLLRFVTLYYVFFDKKSKEALIEFYKKIKLPRPRAIKHRIRTFNLFGESQIDKIALYLNKSKKLNFTFENEEILHQYAREKKGLILLGAHAGNLEIASELLKRIDVPIYVVMYENESKKISKILDQTYQKRNFHILLMQNDLTFLINIKNIIEKGGIVCMHADRFLATDRSQLLDFFGEKAKFSIGPFLLATKLNFPVSMVHAFKTDRFHYYISCTEPITSTDPYIISNVYLASLTQKVKENPYQWYNFYQFWS